MTSRFRVHINSMQETKHSYHARNNRCNKEISPMMDEFRGSPDNMFVFCFLFFPDIVDRVIVHACHSRPLGIFQQRALNDRQGGSRETEIYHVYSLILARSLNKIIVRMIPSTIRRRKERLTHDP